MALKDFKKLQNLSRTINETVDFLKAQKGKDIITYNVSMLVEDVDYSDVQRFVNEFPDKAKIAHREALRIMAKDLELALKEAISASVWDWIDDTRDIVDTGALRRTTKVIAEGSELRCYSDREYAALVHFGGYVHPYGDTTRAMFYYPPRPWIHAVVLGGGPVEQFDFAASYGPRFARQMRKLLKD